jgi:hypothetical protein
MEKDTPGQIYGMTQKSDGKSDEQFETQRAHAEEENNFDSEKLKEKQTQYKWYFFIGVVGITFLAFHLFGVHEEATAVDSMREYYLEKEAARRSKSV